MRLLLIANPAAGDGRATRVAAEAASWLEQRGHRTSVVPSDGPGHAEALARGARAAHDALLAVGGDGTLHEVVNGLGVVESGRVPVGVLPCGSGDSFARDLGLCNPTEALERLDSGAKRCVDLARVELHGPGPSRARLAINVLAWGAGARINRRAESLRWARGRRYDLATLVELAGLRPLGGTAVRDRRARPDELLGVASLTRHSGRGLCLAPRASLDDGLIDLVSIRRGSRLALARVFAAVFRGAHLASPLVAYEQLASFELELWPGAELVLDGELVACESLAVQVLPGALEVLA